MREILFRGKMGDGNWVYGSLLKSTYSPKGETTYSTYWIAEDSGMHWKVIPETVGQFTGLLDKKGNKIFDGDIVEMNRSYHYSFLPKGERYTVVWSDSESGYFLDGTKFRLTKNKVVTIVGNIHDKGE